MKSHLLIALFLLGLIPSVAMAGIAQVKMTPEAAKVGEEVKFLITAEGATQSCGFRIEFGDGDAADVKVGTDENNNVFPKTVAKTYSKPGSYYVTAAGKLVGSFDLFKLSTPYLPCMGEAGVTVKVEEVAVAKPAPAPAAAPVPASKCPDGFEVHMGAANDGSFSCAPKKCPDGMKVKGEVARDGSFSCMPIGTATSEPPVSDPATEDNAQKRTVETMIAFGADHDIGKAKAGYAKAIELDSLYAPAYFGLGVMLEAEEDWEAARRAFKRVVITTPGPLSVSAEEEIARIDKIMKLDATAGGKKQRQYDELIAQARSLLSAGQLADAARKASAAKALDASRWQAYAVAGEVALRANQATQASHFYREAAAHAPSPYKEKLAKVAGELGGDSNASASGKSFRDCADCPEMITIPAGSFDMGSPSYEAGRYDNEGPIHHVSIRSFALGKTAITRGQFAAFVSETNYDAGGKCYSLKDGKWEERNGLNWRDPGYRQDDSHPVACINWNDAQAYTAWLSRKAGKKYRLPTEAEWEYAARAGTTTARYWGDSPDQACGYANVAELTAKNQINGASGWAVHNCTDGFAYTAPVGSFKPNAFGLYDMLGNVWQWVEDNYHDNYGGAPTDGSVWQGGDSARRVLRGGSWNIDPRNVRSAIRNRSSTAYRYDLNGFRLARTLP